MTDMILGVSIVNVIVAAVFGFLIVRIGLVMLRALAAPRPEPPPPGELRKVKIQYRCALCGTEVRMTVSNDVEPDAPRHCMQEMDLVAPIE